MKTKYPHPLPLLTTILITILPFTTAHLHPSSTPTYISALLSTHPILLAAFTASSLPSLDPFTQTFATAAQNTSTPYALVDCDATANQDWCQELDVHGYPTIKLFQRSERDAEEVEMRVSHERVDALAALQGASVLRYREARSVHALRSFVTRHSLPILSDVERRDVPAFRALDDVVVLAYLDSDQHGGFLDVFAQVADRAGRDREVVFGVVDVRGQAGGDGQGALDVGVEGVNGPAVVCYKNTDGDHQVLALTGELGVHDVEKWLRSARQNAIKEFRERDIEVFMQRDKLTLYIFLPASSPHTHPLRHTLTPLAKRFAKFVTFAFADAHEYAPMARSFGLALDSEDADASPALVVHAPVNENVFFYGRGRGVEVRGVEDMLMAILQGRARAGEVFGGEEERRGGAEGNVHTEL
ncbi:hypothetical protein IQ07DRAFT_682622 [Pyrenochaeta sp. DS3sAY3a]|nr:hypothetical protein IQ07DRAFT_682622 [Pyrenochaeta sp. DS3sAY3a]